MSVAVMVTVSVVRVVLMVVLLLDSGCNGFHEATCAADGDITYATTDG